MTNTNLTVVALDYRFKAKNFNFDYYVKPTTYPISDHYLELREWCWETFGPACSIHLISGYPSSEKAKTYIWAWDEGQFRIYLKHSKELSLLQLKWM